jgi:hypothetical protein
MQEKKSTPTRKKQTAPSKPKKPASDGGKCECVGDELGLGHEADCPWPDYLSVLDEGSEI